MNTKTQPIMLEEAKQRLERLSRERLRVALDFLAYLEEREQSEATEELLAIPGFEQAFERAREQREAGKLVRFEDVKRDG
jgi:hypothetical protein